MSHHAEKPSFIFIALQAPAAAVFEFDVCMEQLLYSQMFSDALRM
jgi:hypothetical protein